jgi:hypothetical protein
MDIHGIEPSKAPKGTLVLVFWKIVWTPDAALIAALQTENVVGKLKYVARAFNTKVLAFPWVVPQTSAEAAAQRTALATHSELKEARAFPIPELAKFFIDDDDEPTPFMDGGEFAVAMARAAPEHLAEAIPYLRAPQRADWFMDALFDVATSTKNAADRALIFDAIAQMPVPPKSNKHHKTYVAALTEGATAYRAAKDAKNAQRLEEKAAMFGKKR